MSSLSRSASSSFWSLFLVGVAVIAINDCQWFGLPWSNEPIVSMNCRGLFCCFWNVLTLLRRGGSLPVVIWRLVAIMTQDRAVAALQVTETKRFKWLQPKYLLGLVLASSMSLWPKETSAAARPAFWEVEKLRNCPNSRYSKYFWFCLSWSVLLSGKPKDPECYMPRSRRLYVQILKVLMRRSGG